MVFLAKLRFGAHTVLLNTLNDEQCHHTVLYRLNLYELVDVYLIMQSKLRLFIDLTQGAIDRRFTLINFAFREVQLFLNPVSRIVINDE